VLATAEQAGRTRLKAEGTLQAFSESCQHTGLSALDSEFCEEARQFRSKRIALVHSNIPPFFE
jgi:hypothetical protein